MTFPRRTLKSGTGWNVTGALARIWNGHDGGTVLIWGLAGKSSVFKTDSCSNLELMGEGGGGGCEARMRSP